MATALDFRVDIKREILNYMPYEKTDSAVVTALSLMPLETLLIHFINWLNRLVHPHPRAVLESRELSGNALRVSHGTRLDEIIGKCLRGNDLNSHLSRKILDGFTFNPTARKNLNKRSDLDLLLNDWGIHHMHLSNVLEADGFVERDDIILFAIFSPTTVYILDLARHGTWTDQHFVEVAVRNWPDSDLYLQVRGLGAERPLSRDERKVLRGKGVFAMVPVDGNVYFSNSLGLTSAGTSTRTSYRAQNLLQNIDRLSENILKDPTYLRPCIEQMGKQFPTDPSFDVVFVSGRSSYCFGVRELQTEAVVGLAEFM